MSDSYHVVRLKTLNSRQTSGLVLKRVAVKFGVNIGIIGICNRYLEVDSPV